MKKLGSSERPVVFMAAWCIRCRCAVKGDYGLAACDYGGQWRRFTRKEQSVVSTWRPKWCPAVAAGAELRRVFANQWGDYFLAAEGGRFVRTGELPWNFMERLAGGSKGGPGKPVVVVARAGKDYRARVWIGLGESKRAKRAPKEDRPP